MTDRTNEPRQDQNLDEIIELTEVVETDSEEPLGEETLEGFEDEGAAGSPESADYGIGEGTTETAADSGEETGVTEEDLDFDALFEELDEEPQDAVETATLEAEPVEADELSPEDEGEITGGIHTPDNEEDFDALLEDLDKSEDMLASLEDPEETDWNAEEEEPVPLGEEEISEELETAEEISDELEMEEEVEATSVLEETLDPKAAGREPTANEGPDQDGIDLRELADRVEKLESARQETEVDEERLLQALNDLPSDAPFWSRVEEHLQNALENGLKERTQELERRIANFQQRLEQIESEDQGTLQILGQQIREMKNELPSAQDLEEHKQSLRRELEQEIESRIPAAAARIIREEIQNMRSELEE